MQVIPKSTAKLSEGDFCWIMRNDNTYVPFVFIEKEGASRSYFFGGLLYFISNTEDINDLPENLNIYEQALLHIECFKKNDTPIIGNIISKINREDLEKAKNKTKDQSIGATSKVWGYRTIYKYANLIEK